MIALKGILIGLNIAIIIIMSWNWELIDNSNWYKIKIKDLKIKHLFFIPILPGLILYVILFIIFTWLFEHESILDKKLFK